MSIHSFIHPPNVIQSKCIHSERGVCINHINSPYPVVKDDYFIWLRRDKRANEHMLKIIHFDSTNEESLVCKEKISVI